MRLDQYLAKKRNGLTRAKAQRAIKLGFVSVNGTLASKPAYLVKDTDTVSITNRNIAKMPSGYFKLHEIQGKTQLIKKSDVVLDLASGATGYLLAAAELAKQVFGVESNKQFEKPLRVMERKHPNIKITIGDVFTTWPSDITGGASVDIILNDLPSDWKNSIAATHNVLPLLKKDGKVLMTVKQASKQPTNIRTLINAELEPRGLVIEKVVKLASGKDEFYVILARK